MIDVFEFIDFETGKKRRVFFVGSKRSVERFSDFLYRQISYIIR